MDLGQSPYAGFTYHQPPFVMYLYKLVGIENGFYLSLGIDVAVGFVLYLAVRAYKRGISDFSDSKKIVDKGEFDFMSRLWF